MYSALCLIVSLSILTWIIRYRVHVHVSYTPPKRRPSPRKQPRPAESTTEPATEMLRNLTDSLIGLGAQRKIARAAALKAMNAPAATFEEKLRVAIREAHAA